MRLSPQLLTRITGRTGKITCKVCDTRLRLDFRGEDLFVATDGVQGRVSAAAMLSRPSGSSLDFSGEADGPGAAPSIEISSDSLDSLRPAFSLPPPLPRVTHDESASSLMALASQSTGGHFDEEPLPLVSRRKPLPLVSRREPLPLVSRRSSSAASLLSRTRQGSDAESANAEAVNEERKSSGSLSPYILDEDDDSAHTRPVSPSRAPQAQSTSRSGPARSLGPVRPGAPSRVPAAPPRPWELTGMRSSSGPAPFERFGLSSAPALPNTIELTPDGRLVNASDRPALPARRRRRAVWALPALLVVGVALGAAAGQNFGIEATPAAREIDIEATTPAAATPREASAAPEADVERQQIVETEPPVIEIAPVTAGSELTRASVATPRPVSTSPKADEPAAAETAAKASESLADSASALAAAPSPETSAMEELGPFNSVAAGIALDQATAHAAGCRKEGDPSGVARVAVTYAPSGRATSATISGPPFSGTETGSCIASRFRGASVPPFAGEHVTVSKTVVIQ